MSHNRNSPNQLPKTCPWIMRVGVFFDGTGNNKENDRAIGEMSNIAKLSDYYKESEDEERLEQYSWIYKNGVGTINGEDDVVGGLAKGEGGIERVHEAIKEVAEFFDTRPCAKEFIVDVFGFSRGAALARHFVNELHDRAAGPNVKVGFVGIYDTVASFAGSWWGILGLQEDQPGDNINVAEWKVEKGTRTYRRRGQEYEVPYYEEFVQPYNFNLSSASADYVEHFVARDEVRKNFPLSSIEPNDGGFLNENSFIGVHSDIGGGYGPNDDYENRLDWIASYRQVPGARIGPSDRAYPGSSNQYRLIARYSEDEVEAIKEAYWNLGYDISEKKYGLKVWLVGKKSVTNTLANVYLRLMHKRAIESEVPFIDLPSGNEYDVPPELTDYWTTLINGETYPGDKERDIYANFVHQSDVDANDRAPIYKPKSYFGDLANEPGENHIRTIFPNDSTLAIVPEANDNSNANGAEINKDNLAEREDGENT